MTDRPSLSHLLHRLDRRHKHDRQRHYHLLDLPINHPVLLHVLHKPTVLHRDHLALHLGRHRHMDHHRHHHVHHTNHHRQLTDHRLDLQVHHLHLDHQALRQDLHQLTDHLVLHQDPHQHTDLLVLRQDHLQLMCRHLLHPGRHINLLLQLTDLRLGPVLHHSDLHHQLQLMDLHQDPLHRHLDQVHLQLMAHHQDLVLHQDLQVIINLKKDVLSHHMEK